MDLVQLLTQAGLVFLKEGVSFLFSSIKDRKSAQKAEEDSISDAKLTASEGAKTDMGFSLPAVHWDKVGTLFWLGNDIMWIQDMVHRAAPPHRVLQGVTNVEMYLRDLGFENKSLGLNELTFCRDILESLVGFEPKNEQELAVLRGHYESVNKYIETTKWFLNAWATKQQPGFNKYVAA